MALSRGEAWSDLGPSKTLWFHVTGSQRQGQKLRDRRESHWDNQVRDNEGAWVDLGPLHLPGRMGTEVKGKRKVQAFHLNHQVGD